MRKELFDIEGPWQGRLSMAPRPRGDDWLEDELKGWRNSGFDVLVSLLTPSEERELGIEGEGNLAGRLGFEYHSMPIPDRGVPQSRAKIDELVSLLHGALLKGQGILIHCRQGIGRSALIAASVLASFGIQPQAAWSTVESARGRPVPDTPEQKSWLRAAR